MLEYEYIIDILEGYLCDSLTALICSENYRNKTYELGYRNLFSEFRNAHDEFQNNKEKYLDSSKDIENKKIIEKMCSEKRCTIRKCFLNDLLPCSVSKNSIQKAMEYFQESYENEDNKTLAKRLCEFPYGVKLLRQNEKGEGDIC